MKRKIKMKKTGILVVLVLLLGFGFLVYKFSNGSDGKISKIIPKNDEKEITDFENLSLEDAKKYASKKKLEVKTTYEYDDN